MKAKSGIVEAFVFLLMFQALVFPFCLGIGNSAETQGWQPISEGFSYGVAEQYLNVTHEGDLVINENQTYTIEDQTFSVIGKITVKDTSSLIIRNSNFTVVPPVGGDSIELIDQANLVVASTTMTFRYPDFSSSIIVQDNAEANITDSKLQSEVYLAAYNSSLVYVKNCTIMAGANVSAHSKGGVATYDTSSAEIENSAMYGVFVWGNSSVSVNDSTIAVLWTGWRESDKTSVEIVNSEVQSLEALDGAPTIRVEGSTMEEAVLNDKAFGQFESTSLGTIAANGNAFALLIDSSAGSIKTSGNAAVLVGWRLPLSGVVAWSYRWIPIIQLSLATSLIVMIIFGLFVLRRRMTMRAKKQELPM